MIDMGSIAAATSSLRVAGEIAVGLINLKTMAEVQAKAIELNQKIIAAQHDIFAANAAQSTLIQRVNELEEEIARVKAWKETKQRYVLVSPSSGFFAYALKSEGQPPEPAHWICAGCYEEGSRSILHGEKVDIGRKYFQVCPRCKTSIQTGHGPINPTYA